MLDTSESFYRANGGALCRAVYENMPTTNYVRYIVKLINQIFLRENV